MSIIPPTILIKKTDGTQVRMTMDEFKIYKQNLTKNEKKIDTKYEQDTKLHMPAELDSATEIKTEIEPELNPQIRRVGKNLTKDEIESEPEIENSEISQSASQSDNDLPVVSSPHELATSIPVTNIFIDEAVASIHPMGGYKWDKEDHESLLEDVDYEIKKMPGDGSLPDQKLDLFGKIVKNLSFTLSDDLQGRFHSLVTSYLKEIRNDEQLLTYATNDKQVGGLGLNNDQAEELLQIVSQAKNKKKPETISPSVLPDRQVKTGMLGQPQNKRPQIFRASQGVRPVLHDVMKLSSKNTNEDVREELVEAQKKNTREMVGPIDELKEFSLVDFRRLSEDSATAAEILLAKVQNLKKDSYSIFLRGLIAWQQSPLYKIYQEVVKESINRGVSINDLFFQASQEKLQSDEFISLIEMNKNLGF